MAPEQRETLTEHLKELDDAMRKIEAAREPFDDAAAAVYRIKEALLEQHEAEIVARCEGCTDPIFEGDLGHHDGENYFCVDCAPTWGDISKHALESPAEAWEEPDGRARCLAACDEHEARGGSPDDKHVWEL